MPAIVTPLENKITTIAFARRVADHIAIGASAPTALRIVAEQLRETDKQSAMDIAAAAHKIARALCEGSTKDAWAPHTNTLGDHLVGLVGTAYDNGGHNLSQALRAAADTLEGDVRIGFAS